MTAASTFEVRFVMLTKCDQSTPDRVSITFPNDDREQEYAVALHSEPVNLTTEQASECWGEIQKVINRFSGRGQTA